MKTDIEIIREMLTRSRIAFGEGMEDRRDAPKETDRHIMIGEYGDFIKRKNGDKKHVGYYDFYSTFYFDKNGMLLNIGIWE